MTTDTMRERFCNVTSELIDSEERLAIVLADISVGYFLPAYARHRDRVVNVGIREQLMVNVAAGMALEGMRPIVHTFAPFLIERSFEQVKLGFSHQGVGGILVSAGGSYDLPAYGRTHQTSMDVALVASLPGWRIDIPGHPDEAEALLRDAVASDDAVYIRLSDQQNAAPVPVEGGRMATVRSGATGAPVVVAVGPMLDAANEATSSLDVTLLYASTVRPFDAATLRGAVTGSDVILVEPVLEGTSAAEVSAALNKRPHRLLSIGVPNAEHRKYGSLKSHNRALGLDAEGLRARITAWL